MSKRKSPRGEVRSGIDGARVRSLRTKLGLTQLDVSKLTDIHPGKLSQIESGKKGVMDHSLKTLVLAFKTNADYLLHLTDDPSPPRRSSS